MEPHLLVFVLTFEIEQFPATSTENPSISCSIWCLPIKVVCVFECVICFEKNDKNFTFHFAYHYFGGFLVVLTLSKHSIYRNNYIEESALKYVDGRVEPQKYVEMMREWSSKLLLKNLYF